MAENPDVPNDKKAFVPLGKTNTSDTAIID